MAEFREDDGAYPVMIALAACAQDELIKSGLDPISKVMLQPGSNPVFDWVGNGKECGEIIVNLANAFAGFPSPDPEATCGSELSYTVELGVFRCAVPMGGTKQSPKPPPPEDQTNSTRLHLADMAAMKRAIQCCMQDRGNQYVLGSFLPYGPSGNVVGGVWQFTLGPPDTWA